MKWKCPICEKEYTEDEAMTAIKIIGVKGHGMMVTFPGDPLPHDLRKIKPPSFARHRRWQLDRQLSISGCVYCDQARHPKPEPIQEQTMDPIEENPQAKPEPEQPLISSSRTTKLTKVKPEPELPEPATPADINEMAKILSTKWRTQNGR